MNSMTLIFIKSLVLAILSVLPRYLLNRLDRYNIDWSSDITDGANILICPQSPNSHSFPRGNFFFILFLVVDV